MATEDSFTFQEAFQYSEIELKGEKKFFIEGFISTSDPDLSNEVITEAGLKDMVAQCNQRLITMDVEHEEWYQNGSVQNKPVLSRIPVAKIVSAELKNNGVWVKAELNKNSERFAQVKGSVIDGFLHSFSVAFYPLRAITKKIGDQVYKLIDSLSLVNVTLTGSPVNPNATFTPVIKAALRSMPQGENMEDRTEAIIVSTPVSDVKAVPVAEPVAVIAAPVVEIKSDSFDAKSAYAELKSMIESMQKSIAVKADDEKKEEVKEDEMPKDENIVSQAPQTGLAALGGQNLNVASSTESFASIKALQEEVADLKAKLAEPVIKGIGPEASKVQAEKLESQVKAQSVQIKSVLDQL